MSNNFISNKDESLIKILKILINNLKNQINNLLSEKNALQEEIKKQQAKIEKQQKFIKKQKERIEAHSQESLNTQSRLDELSMRLNSMNTAAECLFNAIHEQSRDLWIAIQWLLGFAKLYSEGYSFSDKELEYGFDLMIAQKIVKFKTPKESSAYFNSILDLVINSRLGRKQLLEKEITLLMELTDMVHKIPNKRDGSDWATDCCVCAEEIRTKLTEHGVSILYYKEIVVEKSKLQFSRFFTAGTNIIFDVPILLIDIENDDKELLSDSGYYRT